MNDACVDVREYKNGDAMNLYDRAEDDGESIGIEKIYYDRQMGKDLQTDDCK